MASRVHSSLPRLRDQLDSKRLVLAILRCARTAGKESSRSCCLHGDVEALQRSRFGQSARNGVGRICARRTAEEISRELIQHNDGGQQRALRRGQSNPASATIRSCSARKRSRICASVAALLANQRACPARRTRIAEPRLPLPRNVVGRMRAGHDSSAKGSGLDRRDRRLIRQAGQTQRRSQLLSIGRHLKCFLAHELGNREVRAAWTSTPQRWLWRRPCRPAGHSIRPSAQRTK